MAQYDALAATFKSKYKNLPGDATVFGCTADLDGSGNTCNNGAIEAYDDGDIWFYGETGIFWKHLSDSGFRPEGVIYTATIPATNTVTVDINVPKAQIGTAGVAVYGTVAGGNFYLVGGYTTDAKIDSTEGLSAVDSVAFDQKVDDGVANAGNVQSTGLAGCNTVATTYTITSGSTLVCSLTVKLMSGMSF
jgi:hypothetical protein